MQTFNQALATLYFKKQITLQLALAMSSVPDELQDMINRGTGVPAAVQQRSMPAATQTTTTRPGVVKR
jgi:Tfp pilus assembly ATPase PilU